MIKTFLLYITLTFLYSGLYAQDVVLDKNVDEQYSEKKGPNMRRYGHFYEGIGFVVPYKNVPGASTDFGRSGEFALGYRYKLKLLSFYAIGFDISNRWLRYGIKSEDAVGVDLASNPLSQASQVDKMSLCLASFGGELYNRINIGRRGNVLGNFIDIGLKGEWNYGRKILLKKKAAAGDYYEKSRTVQKNLNFIEKFSTLITARIGINKVCIYGNYRFTDLITSGYSTPELPPLNAGIQLAF
jgi:hypothetical protein